MPTLLTLAMIASDVYDDTGTGSVVGYRRLSPTPAMASANTRPSSFFGAAYGNGAVGVVAFRGSAERTDWLDADADIGLGRLPIDQWGDATSFFIEARRQLSSLGCSRIVITGHSLGGGLTQLVGAGITSVPVVGVTFNAPGMGSLTGSVSVSRSNASNLFHYRARHDPVSMVGAHIGHAPVVVDVSLGLGAGVAVAAVGGVSPLLGAAARGGLEHTLGPMISALQSGAMGGIRY
jgi:hypothetical protein